MIVKNRREEIAEVAREHGWSVEYGGSSRAAWLKCVARPEPDAPLGGPRHVVEIYFDVDAQRLIDVYMGVGRPRNRQYGGTRTVAKILKKGIVQ